MYRDRNRQIGISICFAYRLPLQEFSTWIRLTLFGIFPTIQKALQTYQRKKIEVGKKEICGANQSFFLFRHFRSVAVTNILIQ